MSEGVSVFVKQSWRIKIEYIFLMSLLTRPSLAAFGGLPQGKKRFFKGLANG
jgi:hypothetical protein